MTLTTHAVASFSMLIGMCIFSSCKPVSAHTTNSIIPSSKFAGAEARKGKLSVHQEIALAFQQKWLQSEGVKERGHLFEQLTLAVNDLRMQEPPLRTLDALALLGPPDYGGETDKGGEFVYLYSYSGNDGLCVIYSEPGGNVVRFGWNDRASFRLDGFPRYSLPVKID